jgi:hypothetical protein
MNSPSLTSTSLHYTGSLPDERTLADWRRRRDVARAARHAVRLPRLVRQPRMRPARSTS